MHGTEEYAKRNKPVPKNQMQSVLFCPAFFFQQIKMFSERLECKQMVGLLIEMEGELRDLSQGSALVVKC